MFAGEISQISKVVLGALGMSGLRLNLDVQGPENAPDDYDISLTMENL